MVTYPQSKLSLLIADDHLLTHAGIRALLKEAPDIEVVGEAWGSYEVRRLIAESHPKIVLLNLKMSGTSLSKLGKWVCKDHPETTMLALTNYDRDAYLARAMEAGVVGCLEQCESVDRLIGAIRRAAQGEILFDENQISRVNAWQRSVKEKLDRLTGRERQILGLLAQGMSNKTIARALCISLKTVEYHITHILGKLDLSSRQEAEAWALKHFSDEIEDIAG